MNYKWLSLLALVAFLIARVPSSCMVAADEDDLDEDTVEGEEVMDDAEDMVIDEEPEEEETEADADDLELGPTSEVNTTAIIPEHTDLEIPAGSIVTALVGLHNKAESPFTVVSVEGAIKSPQDHSQAFQNFTAMPIEMRVDAGQQATFNYKLRPSERFEPRQFALTVTVHLQDAEDGHFVNTAFNQTITLVDPESDFDTKTAFGYVAVAAIAALAYLYIRRESEGPQKKKEKPAKRVETGTNMRTQNEWLEGTNAVVPRRRKRSSKQ